MRAIPALVLLLASLVSGCGDGRARPVADPGAAGRQVLNEGYSMLYGDAGKIDRVRLILWVKTESAPFEDLVKQAGTFGESVREDLERFAREYPGLRIDLDALPKMETRKRDAIGMDFVRRFAPVTGLSGAEYERAVLISLLNGLNHEGNLCRVMAEDESDPELRRFLVATGQRYGELYEAAFDLLAREHFRPLEKS